MSLNQFTDLTYKPWMKIAANTVNAVSSAIVDSTGKISLQTPQSVPTPIGGVVLAHPISQSVSFPNNVPTIAYNEVCYFSALNGGCNVVNGTSSVTLSGAQLVYSGINYTSYDNTNLTIAIGGYYKVDYAANVFFVNGAQCEMFTLQVVKPGQGAFLTNSLSNPTNGKSSTAQSFMIGNSGIVKLNAGDVIVMGYICLLDLGTAAVNLSLVLLDSVSA